MADNLILYKEQEVINVKNYIISKIEIYQSELNKFILEVYIENNTIKQDMDEIKNNIDIQINQILSLM